MSGSSTSVHATKTRLTFGPSTQRFPVWTPDGKTVFYGSTGKGALHIYAKDTDGSSPERVVLESSDGFEYPECFSPDQRFLVYVRVAADSKTSADIWALPLFGERKPFPIVQTAFRDFEPAVSPDSKWMAYENNESGRNEIYVTAFPGGGAKWQASANGGSVPRWRRTGGSCSSSILQTA